MGFFGKKNKIGREDEAVVAKKEKIAGSDKNVPSMKELYGQTEVKTGVKTEKGEKKTRTYGNAYSILIKPLITEKAANLAAENKYVFAVAAGANKIEIAKAVKEVYGIEPKNVNIINVKGKKVKYGRTNGVRKNWRKAVVMLPKGKSINIYEGV